MTTPTPDEQALTEQIEEIVRGVLRRRALIPDVDLPEYIARAVLPVVKAAQRDAWADCAGEALALGWLHEPAHTDMIDRNPHEETP